jgi:OFA family oxalate/formate antiporter-like MFS transporter
MFVSGGSGPVVTAQVAPIARDYKIAGLPVNLFIAHRLIMAGIVDNILNGLARPTFGWVSDHIIRENTMAIVACGAVAYWALGTIGNTPWTIATAGLVTHAG